MRISILTILLFWAGVSPAQSLVWKDSTSNAPIGIVSTLVTTSQQNVVFNTVYSQDYGHTGGAYSVLRLLDVNSYAVIDSLLIGSPWSDAVLVDLEHRNDTIYGLAYTSTRHSNANEVYLMRLAPDLSVYSIDTILYFSFSAHFEPGSIELLGKTAYISGVASSPQGAFEHVVRLNINSTQVHDEYIRTGGNPFIEVFNDGSLYTYGLSFNYFDPNSGHSTLMDTRLYGIPETVIPINDSQFLFAGGGYEPAIGLGTKGDTLPTRGRFLPTYPISPWPFIRSCPKCIALKGNEKAFLSYTHGASGPLPSDDGTLLAVSLYDYQNDSIYWTKTFSTGDKEFIYGTHYSGNLLYFYGGSQDLSVYPGAVKTRPFIYAIDSTGSFLSLPDANISSPKSCLTIYPTLVDQYMKIASCQGFQQLLYKIISITGVQVASGEFYPDQQANGLFIGHLKPGVYIVQLLSNNQVLSQRIVKK